MSSVVGLTLIKRLPYRGDAAEEFSNTYHFTGDIPADSTAWKALADALIAQEKTLYISAATVVRAYGYDSDDPTAHSVWSWDYFAAGTTVAGTLSAGSGAPFPGDAAAWIRWKTSRLNTKGKAIFLRKYYHGQVSAGLTHASADTLDATWGTAAGNFATKMTDGTFLDARTIRSRDHSETILSHAASVYVTTRTLKRRGKRPGS